MKKFVVNSTIPSSHLDPVAWVMGTPKMLKNKGVKDVEFKTCYCCTGDNKVICEFDAQDKDSLSNALSKINFPVDSIMETKKLKPEK